MSRIWVIAICLCVFTNFCSVAQTSYNVAAIPAILLKNANAVIRTADKEIEIKNSGKCVLTEKIAISILNPAADDYSSIEIAYDKMRQFKNVTGVLYDANGNKIKSLGKSDVYDRSASSSNNLMDDSRVKICSFHQQTYPYTVEYEYSIQMDTYFMPDWLPVIGDHVSVEESSLHVEMPENYVLRYKVFNYAWEPITTIARNIKKQQWVIKNYPALVDEIFSVPRYQSTPSVLLAPSTFRLQNMDGDMSEWNSVGRFFYQLNAGRDKLPETIKTKVHQLTDQVSSRDEKISILYNYMQQNTRYISIQLGIGGLQTFEATNVAANGYGDCKALSNYMYSLLKEAGIPAYCALIKSGTGEQTFLSDFPSHQFDHVIVCAPVDKDTMWLECTNQDLAPGYLGSFTSNRNALLVGEQGGMLVKTPRYTKSDNSQIRKMQASMDAEGNLSLEIITHYHAEQQDQVEQLLSNLSKENISDFLKDKLPIASYDILKWNYTREKSRLPVINEELQILAHNYGSLTGKRLFIAPDILNRSGIKISEPEERKTAILLSSEYTDIDTVEINTPTGYVAESIPAPVTIDTKFGKFNVKTTFSSGKIIYIRSMERNSGLFPANDAVALADFYNTVYKADRARIVLVKKE